MKYLTRWLEHMELEGTPVPPGSYLSWFKIELLVFSCNSSSIILYILMCSLELTQGVMTGSSGAVA